MRHPCVSVIVLLLSAPAAALAADNAATRSFSPDVYRPDSPVTVAIAVTIAPDVSAIALEDAPPAGWVVDEASITASGQWDAGTGKVKWGPFFQGAIPDSVSYQVTPPEGETGEHCFVGELSYDGFLVDITGDDCIDEPIKYSLTVVPDPNACCEVTLDPPGGLYEIGTAVTVTVTTGECCEFDHWEGDLDGSDNPAIIVMDGDKAIMPICNVLGPYTLTIITQGEGTVTADPPGLTYDCNADVSLTPVPAEGWEFVRWEIDLTGSDVPATLVMDDDKSVRVVFARRRFTLTVNVDPNVPCQVILDPPGGTYDYGSVVSLTAVVSGDCHVFDHWDGDLSGDANPAFITIDGHKTVTPVCTKLGPFTLTTIVDGGGTVAMDPNTDAYECGASVTLTLVPAPGWQFDHWEEDVAGSASPAILIMIADKTVRAVFTKIMYTLTIMPGPDTCCEVTADPPTGPYEAGSSVTLTVALGECCVFERWEGDLTGDTNPVTLVMDGNKMVVPVCATLGPYTLNATVQGQGSILPNPDEDAYDCNTPVALTALPAIGWRLDHWEQDMTGSTNPDTVVMDTDKSVRAVFEILQHTLTVDADPNTCEGVTLDPPGGTYPYGTEVTATVELGPCGVLDYWEDDASGTDNPLVITMNGDKAIRPVCHILGPYGLTAELRGDGGIVLEPHQGPYDCNTVVTLTPEPNDGWRFDHWEGNLTGIDVPTTIRMNRDKQVTAVFVDLACPLNLAIEGQGQILLDPPGGRYREGTHVTLTAVAGEGWAFDHWEDALAGYANPVTVSTDCHRTIKAVFLPGKVLAINQQGDGRVLLDPPGGAYRYGTVVTITADPNTGWEFDHWLGDTNGAVNPATIVMDDDKIVMAVFDNQHALTVNIDPNACCQVTVEPNKPTYAFGDVVTLTVITGECCEFERWEGDLTGNANPATITIDDSKTVTAVCRQLGPYTLTANVEGQGVVTLDPPGGTYDCNTPVSLTAEPGDGWVFERWEGDLTGDANSASLMMDEDKTVKAVFISRFWVTIDVADTDQGSVTIAPDGPYQVGDEVALLARPNDGWKFSRWEGDVPAGADAKDPSLTVPMDGNKTLTPVFDKIQYALTIAIIGPGRVEQSLPGKTTFEAGQAVTLTGVPLQACDWFGAWEGDIDPSDPNDTITLTMNSDKQILARFYDGQLSSASGCCGTAACQAGLMSLALLLLVRFGKGHPSRRRV